MATTTDKTRTTDATDAERRITGQLVADDPDDMHLVPDGPATREQIVASLEAHHGVITVAVEDGAVLAPGSWEARHLEGVDVWVDLDVDEDYARRVLGLAPAVVDVWHDEHVNIADMDLDRHGLDPDAWDEHTRDRVMDAILGAQLDAWCRRLEEAGYDPVRVAPWELGTHIAAGWIDRRSLVQRDREHGPDDIDGLWQDAWDEIDVATIARRALRGDV